MMQSRRSATARLARKILVGLFISRKPNTAHRIIALPNTPNNKVRLKTKTNIYSTYPFQIPSVYSLLADNKVKLKAKRNKTKNYIFDVSNPYSICLLFTSQAEKQRQNIDVDTFNLYIVYSECHFV